MKETDLIFGTCDEQFAKVEKVFRYGAQLIVIHFLCCRKNFSDGWEREGAAFAVYYNGELVVDLNGGYKDSTASIKWQEDTRTVVFSVTKVV
jgi:hypothetical protein